MSSSAPWLKWTFITVGQSLKWSLNRNSESGLSRSACFFAIASLYGRL
ncbi:hypothetical protein [Sorangium sp. So ce117]